MRASTNHIYFVLESKFRVCDLYLIVLYDSPEHKHVLCGDLKSPFILVMFFKVRKWSDNCKVQSLN